MALTKKGNLTFARQPGSELVYRPEGLIEGQIVYHFDWNTQRSNVRALLGTKHPDDSKVVLYAMRETKLSTGKGQAVFDCIGVSKSPTKRVCQLIPQVSTDDIRTHPNFANLAGTLADPAAGALWDSETGEFVAFTSGPMTGVTSYYTGSAIIRATYYVNQPTQFPQPCTIAQSLPSDVPYVSNAANYLFMPPAFDPVGESGIFRVTEEFLGSGPAGWNVYIYAPA